MVYMVFDVFCFVYVCCFHDFLMIGLSLFHFCLLFFVFIFIDLFTEPLVIITS